MQDRRNYVRLFVSGDVDIKTGTSGDKAAKTELIDISYLGFSAYAKEKIEIGTDIQFEIHTDLMATLLSGKGKVQDVCETSNRGIPCFRLGIEFRNMDKGGVLALLSQIHNKISRDKKKKEGLNPDPDTQY